MAVVVFLAGWALIPGPGAFAAPAAEEGAERAAFEAELVNIDRQIWSALRGLERSAGEPVEARALLFREAAESVDDLSRRLASLDAVVPEELRPKVLAVRSLLGTLEHVATGEGVLPPGVLGLPEGDDVTWLGGERLAVPPNDTCDSATLVGKGSFAGDTSLATNSAAVTCGGSRESPDVWFRYASGASEIVVFDTVGSSYDTVLSLHEGCPPDPDYYLGCNDDGFGLQSTVSQNRRLPIGPVWIRVSGFNGASGPFVLNVDNGGVVSGRVTDAATGDPLTGVDVSALLAGNVSVGNGTTDAGGQYMIAGLKPELELFVLTQAATGGYLNELYDDVACEPNGCDFNAATPLTILNGVTTSGVDFAIEPGGWIEGTVVRAGTAEPLMDVKVRLFDAQGGELGASNTDASGGYALGGLPTGTYFVVADQYIPYGPGGPPVIAELYDDLACEGGPPGGCDVTTGTPVAVAVRETTAGIDFVLELEGSVSGTLTESGTGNPVSSVSVHVVDSSGRLTASGFTDETGQYETSSLEAGTYYVATASLNTYLDELYDDVPCPGGVGSGCEPADGTPVPVTSNETTAGIDFVLVPRGSIAGTLTEEASGDPLSFVWVQLWKEGSPSVLRVETTDAAGDYRFDRLDPGPYLVTTGSVHHINELYDDVPCPTASPSYCDTDGATQVVVTDGAASSGVDFALQRRGVIAGTVTLGATGMPLAGLFVRAWDVQGSPESYALTEADGSYVMELLPGTFFVTAADSTATVVKEIYDDIPCGGVGSVCDPTVGAPIVVANDSTIGGIDFALQHKGTLSGTVTATGTGEPLSGALVKVYTPLSPRTVATDSAGLYLFDGLDAGSYFVSAQVRSAGFRDEVFDNVPCSAYGYGDLCQPGAGTPVVIANDTATTGVDFALDRLGVVSGRVTDQSSGGPISGVRLSAYLSDGSEVRVAYTDEDGRYSLQGLSHGPLYVFADKRGLFEELWQGIDCPGGLPGGCEVTAGVPIPISLNGETTGIDFTLEHKGTIAGRVTASATGLPLVRALVWVFDQGGKSVLTVETDTFGRWLAEDLLEGTYFIVTLSPSSFSYASEIYDDIACGYYPCEVTKGTPIVIARGGFVGGIDISLEGNDVDPKLLGSVRDAETGEPLLGVVIDAWGTTGARVRSSITSTDGTFEMNPVVGTMLYLTTDSGFQFVDEVYDDHPCSRGSAAVGLCDPTTGDPMEFELDTPPVTIEFELRRAAVFAGDFESGNLSGWSGAAGGP